MWQKIVSFVPFTRAWELRRATLHALKVFERFGGVERLIEMMRADEEAYYAFVRDMHAKLIKQRVPESPPAGPTPAV